MLTHEVAEAAAKRQSRDSGVGNLPARGGQPVRLRRSVKFAPQHTRRGKGLPRLRVHPNVLHGGEVNHQPVIADGGSGDAVSTPANANGHPFGARELYRRADVGRGGAAGNQRGATIDHAVPNPARCVIARRRGT